MRRRECAFMMWLLERFPSSAKWAKMRVAFAFPIRRIGRIGPILSALGLFAAWIGLPCHPARAGWIEALPDKTVIHVTVDRLPDPTDPQPSVRADSEAIRAFTERFPEIFAAEYRDKYKADPQRYGSYDWDRVEIELRRFSGIEVQGVEIDLLAIAGNIAPDVLYVNFRKSDNYIQNRFLYPLDNPEDGYLSGMAREEIDFRIHPKLWPVIRRKGPDGRMRVWAMPYGGALGKVLLFRKDLFDEKGVAYPTANWTWDDMIAAARRLTDPKRGVSGLLLERGKHESWHWVTFLWSAGGDVMEYDEAADEWRCVFDSREAAVALDYYTRLSAEKWTDAEGKIRRGYSSKDAADSAVKWQRGEIAMMFAYIDEKVLSTINPEITGMVPVPLGPTGKRGGELNSRMFGLFSGIEEPAVRDAAWEYLKFYDSPEALKIKTRVMVDWGMGQFVNPKYLRLFGYPEIERLAPKGWSDIFEIAIASGMPEPYGRNSNVAYDLMTFPMQEAEQLALNDQLPEDPQARLDVMHGLLKKACARANEEMIGIIPPREMAKRRFAAAVALAAIVAAFVWMFRHVTRAFLPPAEPGRQAAAWAFRKYAWAYVILLPAALTIFLWQYVPLLRGSVMAFQDYAILGDSAWIGLDNFANVLYNRYWWQSVWNALRYSALVMALTFLPPIVLAILLQEVPRGKLLFRTIYYLPAVIAGLVAMVMWKQFYEPSEYGALNALALRIPAIAFLALGALLLAVALLFARRMRYHQMRWPSLAFAAIGAVLFLVCAGLARPILFPPGEALATALARLPARCFATAPEPHRWLGDPDTAMLACVIPLVWAGMGPGCLIYLAALKGIADDYYEAADIDGATFIDKILFVIFPILRPLIIINFVGVFIQSWYNATGNILVMTGGGANTEVAGLHIWYKAFTFLKFGPATAMAWMLGFMLVGFTVYQLKILSRVEFRAAANEE